MGLPFQICRSKRLKQPDTLYVYYTRIFLVKNKAWMAGERYVLLMTFSSEMAACLQRSRGLS
jgi:hypothetical protein